MSNAVEISGLYKIFPSPGSSEKPVLALNNINMCIKEDSISVIAGANGSGKSVLMQIISGLMEASKGTVKTSGKPGLVFQEASTQILGDTPAEDVAVGPRNLGVNKKELPLVVEKALTEVNLISKQNYPAEFLSGGEKRRLAVASICAMNRNIIIFDEPYANLDYPGVKDVNHLIEQLHESSKTIIILTHELEKCLGMADNFFVLNRGNLVYSGTPEDALENHCSDFENWGIRNPLNTYKKADDLIWH